MLECDNDLSESARYFSESCLHHMLLSRFLTESSIMMCIGIKTQYATCILAQGKKVRSAVHPSLSNRVFMVASEPDLPERAGRWSIWTGKIGDKGMGKNKGKDKGKQGKKGRKGPPEPPWRRFRRGKGNTARAGAEPAAPEQEPEQRSQRSQRSRTNRKN